MPTLKFSMKIDTSSLDAAVADHVRNQFPYASSVALNKTANAVMAAERRAMASAFDAPTQYTLNSLRVVRSTKANLVAEVRFKDGTSSSRSAEKYIVPEAEGGDRRVKGIELYLRAHGLLPSGMYIAPGAAAVLDAYGNLSRSQYSQIIKQLEASRSAQIGPSRAVSVGNRRSVRRKRPRLNAARYFIGQPGGGRLPLGVWVRYRTETGYTVRPVLIFVDMPHYKPRFQFDEIGEATAGAAFPTEMQAALAMAMRTTR